jgi:Glycosyltransferase family 87
MAESQTEIRPLPAALIVLLAVVGAASMIAYHQGLFMPRVVAVRAAEGLGHGYSLGNDFYQIWLTSRESLKQPRNLYAPEMTRAIQMGLFGRPLDPNRPEDQVDQRRFPYPAFTDLLFWPTAYVGFDTVRVWVTGLLALLTLASVPIWFRAMNSTLDGKWIALIALLVVSSYPALEGLYAGQIGLLVAFLFSASILALQRGRFLFSGFLLALTTVKPQVSALTILFLLLWSLDNWRARNRFCLGLLATLTLLLGSSLAVFPHWIESWLDTLFAYHSYTRPPLVTEALTSWLTPRLSSAATILLTVASVVAGIALAWRNRAATPASPSFWLTLTVLLCITVITILPGQAVYDHCILLPGIFLLGRYRQEIARLSPAARMLLRIGALVLFWPWIAAFGLIAARPFIPASRFDSTVVFSLPLRASVPLPFAVLALLAWMSRINALRNREFA